MKIKTKSLKRITSIVLTREAIESIVAEWERYCNTTNTRFDVVINEDGDVTEFVLDEDE